MLVSVCAKQLHISYEISCASRLRCVVVVRDGIGARLECLLSEVECTTRMCRATAAHEIRVPEKKGAFKI